MAIMVDILICEPTETRHQTAFVLGAEMVPMVMPAGLLMIGWRIEARIHPSFAGLAKLCLCCGGGCSCSEEEMLFSTFPKGVLWARGGPIGSGGTTGPVQGGSCYLAPVNCFHTVALKE